MPDEVLDAWDSVQWRQFRLKDSIARKGGGARLHAGLVAQQIDEAFRGKGADASRYGLFCHDEWPAEPEERDAEGKLVKPASPAGDAYAVRYEEALSIEAAYQRRRAERAEARITALERRLDEMEAVFAALGGPMESEE